MAGNRHSAAGTGVLMLPILWWTLGGAAAAQPTTRLEPETVRAFEGYVASHEEEFLKETVHADWPLWLTDARERARVKSGRIVVEKALEVPDIPGGLVHEWSGAVFIQGKTVGDVIALLTDYDRHKKIYPEVIDSRILERRGNRFRCMLRLKKEKVLTVVLDTEHEAELLDGVEGRKYLFSHSTRIAEVKNAGETTEKELPVGEDSGFLWRLNAYWGFEPDQDGVWVECTTISLSRRIPWGLGWLIQPIVEDTPRKALEETLQSTRLTLLGRGQ